mgnify:CR=1 FL=1
MEQDLDRVIEFLQTVHPFRLLETEDDLRAAASAFEIVTLEAGRCLIEPKAEANTFYLVWSGQLSLTYTDKHGQPRLVNALQDGDFFGFEALFENSKYLTRVTAVSDVELLVCGAGTLGAFLADFPEIRASLKQLYDSYLLMLQSPMDWLDEDEGVYYIARRHPVFLLQRLFPPVLFGVVSIPVLVYLYLFNQDWMVILLALIAVCGLWTLIWLAWQYMDWANDFSIITNKRVVFQERVLLLYDSRQEAPLDTLMSSAVKSSQMGRWLGYGNVAMRTYTGTVTFSQLANPDDVVSMLDDHAQRAKLSRIHTNLEVLEGMIEERINGGGRDTAGVQVPARTDVRTGTIPNFLTNLFQMRTEENGVITYRTHWFILLKSIWAPSFILLLLFVILILTLAGLFELLSPGATLALVAVMGVIVSSWWIYRYIDWRNDRYIISDDQIVDLFKRPLGQEEKRAAPLRNIQTIEFERVGLPGLILNFGTVKIRVGDTLFTFNNVYNPSEVQHELFRRLAQRNYRDEQARANQSRQLVADGLGIYQDLMSGHRQNLSNPRRSPR